MDGQTALLDLASRLENYYADQQTYATATLASGKATDVLATNLSPNGWYSLRISSQSQSGFILEAIPQKSQVQDKACKTLTFDNLGIKASTGYLNSCW